MAREDQISGITIVYLIAVGLQVFVLLFLFAKRQIMRFTWASRKEPHTEIGRGAPKWFRNCIVQNFDSVHQIQYEPRMAKSLKSVEGRDTALWHRLAAMSEVQDLDQHLDHAHCKLRRRSSEPFYQFLKRLRDGAFPELPDETLVRIGVLYEWARFSAKPFTHTEFQELCQLLDQLKSLIRRHRTEVASITGASLLDGSCESKESKQASSQPLLGTRIRQKSGTRRFLDVFRNKDNQSESAV